MEYHHHHVDGLDAQDAARSNGNDEEAGYEHAYARSAYDQPDVQDGGAGGDGHAAEHVLNQTSSSASTEIVCHGLMEGTGRSQISWRGDAHYKGTYSFTGSMHGQSNNMSSSDKGYWVSADCGSVKPFSGKMPSMAGRPPAPH